MMTPRYSTSRQKACHQCSRAKARCERSSGHGPCTRCTWRGLPCSRLPEQSHVINHLHNNDTTNMSLEMTQSPSPFSILESSLRSPGRAPVNPDTNTNTGPRAHLLNTPPGQGATPSSLAFPVSVSSPEYEPRHTSAATNISTLRECKVADDTDNNILNFSSLNLLCPINADDIKNRWIQAYIPVPEQTVKTYPPGVSTFIYRTLKSYTATAVKGRGALLPFIHPMQMKVSEEAGASSPLATCLSAKDSGSTSLNLLATFQSYLLYTMTLFFHLDLHHYHSTTNNGNDNDNDNDAQSIRASMTNLQDLACACARRGLLCTAESAAIRARPRWEEWIVAEATRRTLYIMYLFDSILSTQEGLPTFLGVELRGLPAPAAGLLWRARCRREWEAEYNSFLVEWGNGVLTIEELWPETGGWDEREKKWRRERVERWVEGLDEYGTMLYAIMQCTHGA
ncbi:hypothetical protein BDV10DRAFT_198853 [Aspergillus recurvatus]